jgi:hypothetical protein
MINVATVYLERPTHPCHREPIGLITAVSYVRRIWSRTCRSIRFAVHRPSSDVFLTPDFVLFITPGLGDRES